ncbi:MAG: PEP-CTERM sorting domain-containing protein [Terriglobia bacterium]
MFFSAAGFAENIGLTLIPANGNVSGPPGSTVGWGYTITNGTVLWLQAESLSAGSFRDGTPNAIFDFPAIGPFSSVTEAFSPVSSDSCGSPPCGLYEFTWNSNAPIGTKNAGTFIVGFDYFSGDPANPSSIDLGAAPDADASYMASAFGAPAPEPSTYALILAGLLLLAACSHPAWRR